MVTVATGAIPHPHLDGHGIFAIIVFACVSLIVIAPLRIPVPFTVSAAAGKSVRKAFPRSTSADHGANPPQTPNSTSSQRPLTASIRTTGKVERSYVVINHVTAPFIGVLILLATKTIGGQQIKDGIVGDEGVEPYDVLALFIGLAYIAISLDATGLLRYLAFQISLKAGSSGLRLYFLLYFFFWTAGVLVGNDPVILSGTAFLVYFTRVAGISPPSAWIWAQFVAANVSSAVLVSSNPTNLVIASGFGISFPTYTAYMVLPSFASALAALVVILIFFRNKDAPSVTKSTPDKSTAAEGQASGKDRPAAPTRRRSTRLSQKDLGQDAAETANVDTNVEMPESDETERARERERQPTIYIPRTLVPPDVNPRAALVDPKGAIFVSVIMALTLIMLVTTSVIGGVKVFEISLPGAAVCLIRDFAYDYLRSRRMVSGTPPVDSEGEVGIQQGGMELQDVSAGPNGAASVEPTLKVTTRKSTFADRLVSLGHKFTNMFPTVTVVMRRLPFPLLPFAFGMFILVQALTKVGFVDIMASGLGRVCAHGPAATAFFISFLGVALCNIGGTNIGATILLTKSLQSVAFTSALPASSAALILKAALYSVAFGSNVGALGGTFAASLAGLLWRQGLRQGGVYVSGTQFATWCAVVIIPATVAGVAVLLAEVIHFHVGD